MASYQPRKEQTLLRHKLQDELNTLTPMENMDDEERAKEIIADARRYGFKKLRLKHYVVILKQPNKVEPK